MGGRREPGGETLKILKMWKKLDDTGVPLLTARLVVGGVFVWHALKKIGDPVDFLKVLREYELLPLDPPQIINGAAVVLPWVELLAGLGLLLGIAVQAVAILLLGLLLAFTSAVYLRALGVQAAESKGSKIIS